MYVDPSGYNQMSVFDVLGYIISHWNSISSGTSYYFSGGYCTNFNNGLGTNWSSGGGVNSGGSFWGGWHKFHFDYTSLKGLFKVNGHASNTIWNFSIPTFNWGTLFNSGSSASWNEGSNSANYDNSSNNAGADIFDFSSIDGNNAQGGGGLMKINLQSPNVIVDFGKWHRHLISSNFKTREGYDYHLWDIVDISTKRQKKWYKKIYGGMLNTPYLIEGLTTHKGKDVSYSINILDGNFESFNNYRNNYVISHSVGDPERHEYQGLYYIYWHSILGMSVIFTFNSEEYYKYFLKGK